MNDDGDNDDDVMTTMIMIVMIMMMMMVVVVHDVIVSFHIYLHCKMFYFSGRWWVIGSAWAGRDDDDVNNGTTNTVAETADSKLLQLAKKQRMNTEIRRNIFYVMMSSEVSAIYAFGTKQGSEMK